MTTTSSEARAALGREIDERLLRFMSRDYSDDVRRLNMRLARVRGGNAGLARMPPVPFTGNASATGARPIALLGINPAKNSSSQGRAEYPPFKASVDRLRRGDRAALNDIKEARGTYFANPSVYYGRYFTRLGNAIGTAWLGQVARSKAEAMRTLHAQVFCADIFPWFSADVSKLCRARLSEALADPSSPAFEYVSLLKLLLLANRPRWIHCNGLTTGKAVAEAFGATWPSKLEPVAVDSAGRSVTAWFGEVRLQASVGRHRFDETLLVLAHPFMSRPPISHEAFALMAQRWDAWLAHRSRSG